MTFSWKSMFRSVVLIVGLILVDFTLAHAQAIETLIGSVNDAEKSATLMVTTCPDESPSECVLRDLSCSANTPLNLYIAGDDNVERTADRVTALISKGYGTASMIATMSKGRAKVELPINQINVGQNDMNGTWDTNLISYDSSPFFDSLSQGSAEGLILSVAGSDYQFNFRDGDTATIMAFKAACRTFLAR